VGDRINVLDASAVLTYLKHEPGLEIVEAALDIAPSRITAVT
jgi:hypothetical protein